MQTPDPLWRELLPVGYVLLGALISWIAGSASWRRDAAHLVLLDVYRLRSRMWRPGPTAGEELLVELNQVEARMKALGLAEMAGRLSRAVSRFQGYVSSDVDVDALGEPYEVSSALDAPSEVLDEAKERLAAAEAVLLDLMKPLGRVRAWVKRRRIDGP